MKSISHLINDPQNRAGYACDLFRRQDDHSLGYLQCLGDSSPKVRFLIFARGLMTIDSLLQSFQRFGVNLGLERIKNLLEILGNPQDKIPIIHVTGTNGKGSVCAYLSSILSTAGYKVGRYISPHLIDWTERISINGENSRITCQTLNTSATVHA